MRRPSWLAPLALALGALAGCQRAPGAVVSGEAATQAPVEVEASEPVEVVCEAPQAAPLEVVYPDVMPRVQGERLVSIVGGELEAKLEVGLWLDLAVCDDKSALFTTVSAFVLHDGRVYVEQQNLHCMETDVWEVCRVWDPQLGVWSGGDAVRCLESAYYAAYRVEPVMAPDWYRVASGAEGTAAVQLLRYSPTTGTGPGLTVDLGYGEHHVEVRACTDGSFELETACPLPRGCDLQSPSNLPVASWRWHPRDGLQRMP